MNRDTEPQRNRDRSPTAHLPISSRHFPDLQISKDKSPPINMSDSVLPPPESQNVFIIFSTFLFLATLFFVDYQTGHNLGDFDPFPKERSLFHKLHQTTFKLGDGSTFSSNFTGGNLLYVKPSPLDANHYYLGISDDCCRSAIRGDTMENSDSIWFNFKVHKLKQGHHKFTIVNVKEDHVLWRQGILPVYRSNLGKSGGNWKYIPSKDTVMEFQGNGGMTLTWSYFSSSKSEKIEFAFFFRWNFYDHRKWIQKVEKKSKNLNLFFGESILFKELKHPGIPLYVIGQKSEQKKGGEESQLIVRPKNLNLDVLPEMFQGKEVIYISARSRAFGVPSSLILKGLVDFLVENPKKENQKMKKISKNFFEQFVLIFVPILNISGMKAGQSFHDANGRSLDLMYSHKGQKGVIKKVEKILEKLTKPITIKSKMSKTSPPQKPKKTLKMFSYIDLITQLHSPKIEITIKNFDKNSLYETMSIPYLLSLRNDEYSISSKTLKEIDSSNYSNRKQFMSNLESNHAFILSSGFFSKKPSTNQLLEDNLVDKKLTKRIVRQDTNGERREPIFYEKLGQDLVKVILDSKTALNDEELEGKSNKRGKKQGGSKSEELKKVLESEFFRIMRK